MNLPELLKIAEAAKENPEFIISSLGRDIVFDSEQMKSFVSTFNPTVAIELIKRLQEAEKIVAAAENLIKVKGRHHSEQAYNQLVAAMNGGKE